MEIRKATVNDVPEICSCSTESFKDYILLIERLPGPMLEDYYDSALCHNMFVAEEKGQILGFLLIKDGDGDFMWLDVVAVSPRAQGKGVGKALIAYCEEFIKNKGKSECRLYTHVKYKDIQAIYISHGFEIYDRVHENGFERFYMKKRLA